MKSPDPLDIVTEQFRVQPIVEPGTLNIIGLELLNRNRLNYIDEKSMLAVDILAMEHATLLARLYQSKWRIHCNVEISSMVDRRWQDAMAGVMCPSVVVEIVERNELLSSSEVLRAIKFIADGVRNFGGQVALDDVTCTRLELMTIEVVKPEIIKVESLDRLAQIRPCTCATLVIERIETERQAGQASRLGANELQGFWCDVQTAEFLPASFTPPGIQAQQQRQRMVA